MATLAENAQAVKAAADAIDAAIEAKGGTTAGGLRNAAGAIAALPSGGKWDVKPWKNDGATHIWFRYDDGAPRRLAYLYAQFISASAFTVDWGDGSTSTVAASASFTNRELSHTYAEDGDYEMTVYGYDKIKLSASGWLYNNGNVYQRARFACRQLEIANVDTITGACYCNLAAAVKIHTVSGQAVSLPGSCFASSGVLSDVSIPVLRIGTFSFESCSSLVSVDFPACTSIDHHAFTYCQSLVSASLPSCNSLGDGCFQYCSQLASVDISSCRTISANAFHSCTSLVSLSIPTCTNIGNNAFVNCRKLDHIVAMNCESLGLSAFDSCESLVEAHFNDDVLKVVGSRAFSWYQGSSCKSLEIVDGLKGVTALGELIFAGCVKLRSLDLRSCTSISGTSNFRDCKSIEYIRLGLLTTTGNSPQFENCGVSRTADADGIKCTIEVGNTTASIRSFSGFPFSAPTTTKFVCTDGYIKYDSTSKSWKNYSD